MLKSKVSIINIYTEKRKLILNSNQRRVEQRTILAAVIMVTITIIGILLLRTLNSPKGPTFEIGTLVDGTYTSEASEASNGFTGIVNMEVENGIITSLIYDAISDDGQKKSVLAANGEYLMTESNPTWDEQASLLAEHVIDNQSLSDLNIDNEGKTDAISGVSINISEFVNLTKNCLQEAGGQ